MGPRTSRIARCTTTGALGTSSRKRVIGDRIWYTTLRLACRLGADCSMIHKRPM
jgi:hypothetical protein